MPVGTLKARRGSVGLLAGGSRRQYYVEVHGLDQPHARRVVRTVERAVAALPGCVGPRVTGAAALRRRQDSQGRRGSRPAHEPDKLAKLAGTDDLSTLTAVLVRVSLDRKLADKVVSV